MYKSTHLSPAIKTGNWFNVAFFIGRLLVGGFYLYAGSNNLLHLSEGVGYAMFKGVPYPQLSIILASCLLVLGGMSILTGYRPTLGIAAVILFLVPVTLMMHNFWTLADPQARMLEFRAFQVNVALMGSALLLLGVPQPWGWSLDKLSARAKSTSSEWSPVPSVK